MNSVSWKSFASSALGHPPSPHPTPPTVHLGSRAAEAFCVAHAGALCLSQPSSSLPATQPLTASIQPWPSGNPNGQQTLFLAPARASE